MRIINGFSLIETIVYTAIIGSLVTSFVAFSFSIQAVKNKAYVIEETQSNTRIALDHISRLIKSAENIVSPVKGSSDDTLILDMPNTSDNIVISLSDGTLFSKNGSDSSSALLSSTVFVNNLQFINVSSDKSKNNIKIDIGVNYRNNIDSNYNFEYNITTDASTRI